MVKYLELVVETKIPCVNVHVRRNFQARLLEMVLFYDLPGWLRSVCLLLFFSWVGWFAIIIFGSDWVGVNVFGGNPSAASSADNEHEGGIKVCFVIAMKALGFYGQDWS